MTTIIIHASKDTGHFNARTEVFNIEYSNRDEFVAKAKEAFATFGAFKDIEINEESSNLNHVQPEDQVSFTATPKRGKVTTFGLAYVRPAHWAK